MKKHLLIIIGLILLLAACGDKNGLIHEDFKTDLEQVLAQLDVAYEENRELKEKENNILDKFHKKYIPGHFIADKDEYEMNDLEKEIVREIQLMGILTVHDEPLASEKTTYERVRNRVEEYLEIKKTENIPEELVDRHPIYKNQNGVHPEFLAETKELVGMLDDIVIGERETIHTDDLEELKRYIEKYGGVGFEVSGTHYLHNDESKGIFMVLWAIDYDIEKGSINKYNIDRYIEMKEELHNLLN